MFHPYKGKSVTVPVSASKFINLGDTLELKLETHMHVEDLMSSLP